MLHAYIVPSSQFTHPAHPGIRVRTSVPVRIRRCTWPRATHNWPKTAAMRRPCLGRCDSAGDKSSAIVAVAWWVHISKRDSQIPRRIVLYVGYLCFLFLVIFHMGGLFLFRSVSKHTRQSVCRRISKRFSNHIPYFLYSRSIFQSHPSSGCVILPFQCRYCS
jgi:hypothetical protein